MKEAARRLKKYFAFEPKFGWSELIALAALFIAAWALIRPGRQAGPPRMVVTQAEITKAVYGSGEVTHIGVRNGGTTPVTGLQYVFGVHYLETHAPTADQIKLFMAPQYPYDLEIKQYYAYLRVKTPLPPGADFSLSIVGNPIGVTVLTDFGNALYVTPTKR